MNEKTILILGGDNRSLYLGEYLEKQHFHVCYYAFNQADCYESLTDAVNDADFIILPLPLTRDRLTLNAVLFDGTVSLADIYACAVSGKMFLGGRMPKSFCEELDARGAVWCDYFELDELAIYNAVPTAEGVLQILIEELPITIHGMNCAVAGYGKVGKILAQTLKSLGANVTIFARKQKDFADAFAKKIIPKSFTSLSDELHTFDTLINTVPYRVLGAKELDNLNPECVLVEIASAPFGIDFQAAKERAFTVIKAGSLPGKVAPKSAGEIIGRSILPIIRARGSAD
ncbi:MAG: hypothetical protein IJ025_06840 [Clostridia bacterium]|nr:hypothetical protein [Clostridia bacterium]